MDKVKKIVWQKQAKKNLQIVNLLYDDLWSVQSFLEAFKLFWLQNILIEAYQLEVKQKFTTFSKTLQFPSMDKIDYPRADISLADYRLQLSRNIIECRSLISC